MQQGRGCCCKGSLLGWTVLFLLQLRLVQLLLAFVMQLVHAKCKRVCLIHIPRIWLPSTATPCSHAHLPVGLSARLPAGLSACLAVPAHSTLLVP